MKNPTVKFKRLTETAMLPEYKTAGAAGMDLHADVRHKTEILLEPGEIKIVPCGFAIEMPEGMEAQVRARSGLSTRGIVVANAPGTIDCDYRGEVGVILHNVSGARFYVAPGDRIAQMVFAPVYRVTCQETNKLSDTVRGEGGHGSTGIAA